MIMGKTTTTEFATYRPTETRNPHHTGHTPGGSSSGSAAAVADGQVPLALEPRLPDRSYGRAPSAACSRSSRHTGAGRLTVYCPSRSPSTRSAHSPGIPRGWAPSTNPSPPPDTSLPRLPCWHHCENYGSECCDHRGTTAQLRRRPHSWKTSLPACVGWCPTSSMCRFRPTSPTSTTRTPCSWRPKPPLRSPNVSTGRVREVSAGN